MYSRHSEIRKNESAKTRHILCLENSRYMVTVSVRLSATSANQVACSCWEVDSIHRYDSMTNNALVRAKY